MSSFSVQFRKALLRFSVVPQTFTVDDAIEALGFGKFQWKMSVLTGLSWIGDAMEMMILSVLGPQLHCEWRLQGYQVALITSVVFIGMGISSPLIGKVSDIHGRKACLIISVVWVLFYGLLSVFAPGYGWLLLLRGLVGFGLGGAPQAVTLYSEFLPVKSRAISIILIVAYWALGSMFEVLLALWIMPTLGWRWLLGVSTMPMAIYVCFCFWLPESAHFNVLAGKTEKAMATLARIAKENGKALPQGKLIAHKQINRGQIKDLFVPQYRITTLLLWFIWFANTFIYYGIILLTTELLQIGDSCQTRQVTKIEPRCSLECNYLTSDDYKSLLWTTLAEFPGTLVALLAIDCIGRRRTLTLCLFMFFFSFLPLYGCIGRTAFTVFIFIARASITGGFHIAYVYTLEVFPTENRALGIGTSHGLSRIGALITPFVAQVLLRISVKGALSLYSVFGLLGCIAALILPIETLGRPLTESSLNQKETCEQTTTTTTIK
ncbi:LOW QUALITY PROTEIN: synaptic vesicle 2-related protein-like [Anoplopoma fimbria]|uniref:LOW QUALITY PROTEIN: synaptic vesicle 2-related protein-like n=1 Tax=Anoplopoma fimbria TaxID=229290 RepID=UPI0023EBD3D2|nr:LOW QUALITY PROTEIN: synaptic vesicle 2-related protein-like [Anoplopoma fimbria]